MGILVQSHVIDMNPPKTQVSPTPLTSLILKPQTLKLMGKKHGAS